MPKFIVSNFMHFYAEFKRLQLMVYLLVISIVLLEFIGLGDASGWRYRWQKANVVSTGVILAHFAWSQLIYYWDMKRAIEFDNTPEEALVVAGMTIFRGIFYYAVISAFAGGL